MKRLLVIALLWSSAAFAQTPTPATFNPIPVAGASFMSALRTFLLGEDADRYSAAGSSGRMFGDVVLRGCTHGTAAGMTGSLNVNCEAIVDGAYTVDPAASIDYSTQGATASDYCWVILNKDTTTAIGGWDRVAGTHYLTDCTSASGTRPTRPADSTFVMGVTISGSAITGVDILPNRVPWVEEYTDSSEVNTGFEGQFWQNDDTGIMCYSGGGVCQALATADSGGCAECGDSATAFFTAGFIEAARGGTGISTSASTGVPTIASGTWSVLSRLSAALGGTGDDNSAASGVQTWTAGNAQVVAFPAYRAVSPAGEWGVDGTQCTKDDTNALMVTSVPGYLVACADNSAGRIAGVFELPGTYEAGSSVVLTVSVINSSTNSGDLGLDITCQCVSDGGLVADGTFPSAVDVDITFSGSAGEYQTGAASITCGGTCAVNDLLIWRGSIDSTATTHSAPTELKLVSMKLDADQDALGM